VDTESNRFDPLLSGSANSDYRVLVIRGTRDVAFLRPDICRLVCLRARRAFCAP